MVSGLDALHAYAIASSRPPADGARLLSRFRESLRRSKSGGGPRIFVTGSTPVGDSLYARIEESGATIVAEDHDWGDLMLCRRPTVLPAGTSLDTSLATLRDALLLSAPASHTSTQHERAEATRDAIASSRATALLSVVREHDDAPAWDFPAQAELAGVPSVALLRQGPDIPSAALNDAIHRLTGAVL